MNLEWPMMNWSLRKINNELIFILYSMKTDRALTSSDLAHKSLNKFNNF